MTLKSSEMDNKIKSGLKNSLLVFLWFVFPPLFLLFSIKWKVLKLFDRIILTAIAPFTLLILLLTSFLGYLYYHHHIQRGSRSEIETKTGLNFPKYKTVEKKHFIYGIAFTGDFTMKYTVQLDTMHIADFHQQIKNKIELNQFLSNDSVTFWWETDKEGNFSFSHDNFQENLSLWISNKTGEMQVTFGSS